MSEISLIFKKKNLLFSNLNSLDFWINIFRFYLQNFDKEDYLMMPRPWICRVSAYPAPSSQPTPLMLKSSTVTLELKGPLTKFVLAAS